MARKQHGLPWLGREHGRPSWYIYYYDAETKRVRRVSADTDDRQRAEEALGDFIKRRARIAPAGPAEPPERYAIMTALRYYADKRAPELASMAQIGFAIDKLTEHFKAAKVSTLTPEALKAYERERAKKGIKRGTVRRELAVLSAALNFAQKNGKVTTFPRIVLPAPGAAKTAHLDEEEVRALVAATKRVPHLYVWTMLALNTGGRKGALLELTWTQVQFDSGMIYLNPEGREQTTKGRAIVPMSSTLRDCLSQAYQRRSSPFVVEYRKGRVSDIKKAFAHACREAGLVGVTPHTLRHTAGTLMAKGGVDLHVIAKVLGHSYSKTTQLYAHHRPEWLRGAVEIMGKVTG
jgi:integrase